MTHNFEKNKKKYAKSTKAVLTTHKKSVILFLQRNVHVNIWGEVVQNAQMSKR